MEFSIFKKKKKKSLTAWPGNVKADMFVEQTEEVVCVFINLPEAVSSQIYPQGLTDIVSPFHW